MLAMMLVLVLQRDVFVGGGIERGTSFTDTRVLIGKSFGVKAYPFPIKKLGFLYHYQFTKPNISVPDPFTIAKSQHTHFVAPVFRFSALRVQPWIAPGVIMYREKTKISVLGEEVFKEIDKKIAFSVSAGTDFNLWKRMYAEPTISLSLVKRPAWQTGLHFYWRF